MIAAWQVALLEVASQHRPGIVCATENVTAERAASMPAMPTPSPRCTACGTDKELLTIGGLCPWCHRRKFYGQTLPKTKSVPPRECWPREPLRVVPEGMERGAYRLAIAKLRKRQRKAKRKS